MAAVKLCVAGAGAVGKSALCIRFVRGRFVDTYDPTVEDIFRKTSEIDGDARVLEIIDTAGQEEYRTLREIYFREAQGFLIVYSVASAASFQDAQRIKEKLTRMHGEGKPIILVGNKCDLEAEREVPEAEAYEYAVANKIGFHETSAKTMVNVNEAFAGLVRLVDRYRKIHPDESSDDEDEEADEKKPKQRRKRRVCIIA